MDDERGFLRFRREEARKQVALVRVRHWHEYVQRMPDRQVHRQANRCMDCGTPYCHRYCPVHNLIPEWNSLVFSADWLRAWQQLDSTNNFPEFTGRLCPAPCEDACTLNLGDEPVTIKSLELAIAERAWESGWVVPRPARKHRSKSVAIVGSGPAGLACAQQLVRAGYTVTVVERSDRIGGLLRYGIPDFRFEKYLLDRRLEQMMTEGVMFRTGVNAGTDPSAEALLGYSDALVLACGSSVARELSVPGRSLPGIYPAITYLTRQNRCIAGDDVTQEQLLSARGKQVVVIGGGDTGHDCVGTALRQGALEVTQIQYHDRPPRRADILKYWPERMPVLRTADTDEEGARRIWGWDTAAFDGSLQGVERVLLQRLSWYRDADGHWQKKLLDDRPLQIDAQLVILALGYAHPQHTGLPARYALQLDRRGNVAANDADYQSSRPGVFVCGDMRRGQSLVVWAIREGRQCAHAVDKYLSGYSELPAL
jgi:glutamate synthase (NADPH/NADH) small chain